MTTSINSIDSLTSSISVGGSEAFRFNSSGITSGVGNRLAQTQHLQTGALMSGTTLMSANDVIPQQTQGDQYMALTITPTNALSILEIDVTAHCAASVAQEYAILALFRDSTAAALAAMITVTGNFVGGMCIVTFKHRVSAGAITASTFKIRGGATSGTFYLNGSSVRRLGGVMASTMTIKEYLP